MSRFIIRFNFVLTDSLNYRKNIIYIPHLIHIIYIYIILEIFGYKLQNEKINKEFVFSFIICPTMQDHVTLFTDNGF